jgi:hypothetical protein
LRVRINSQACEVGKRVPNSADGKGGGVSRSLWVKNLLTFFLPSLDRHQYIPYTPALST